MKRFLLVVIIAFAVGFLLGSFLACQECFSLPTAGQSFLACLKNLIDGILGSW